MTATTTRQLPWIKYSDTVDRQIDAHTTKAQIDAVATAPYVEQYFQAAAPTYRDAGSSERYTVGYGGERTYQAKPTSSVNGASDKQKDLIDKLLVEKEFITLTEDAIEDIKSDWRKTRKLIDALLAAPRKPYQAPVEVAPAAPARARLDFKSIPDGNYAIDEGNDVIKFYRVSTNGEWKNVQVRASDELHSLKPKAGIAVLHRLVAAGLAESQMLFATKLERCWMCGKSLTDKISRERGMGPDCASK